MGRNCAIKRTTISPTTPMAKLVATRASCLSDLVLTDTSPSAHDPIVILYSSGVNVKEPWVHVRSCPRPAEDLSFLRGPPKEAAHWLAVFDGRGGRLRSGTSCWH